VLLPVTLWYPDSGPGWRGRVYPEVTPPSDPQLDRNGQVAAMTQSMADAFADSIARRPHDWHMLQKVFAADLDPTRDALRTGHDPHSSGAAV
jgi:KDO2-lipid IV(A) lauroyltransferase